MMYPPRQWLSSTTRALDTSLKRTAHTRSLEGHTTEEPTIDQGRAREEAMCTLRRLQTKWRSCSGLRRGEVSAPPLLASSSPIGPSLPSTTRLAMTSHPHTCIPPPRRGTHRIPTTCTRTGRVNALLPFLR
ncbi:unnamed protein product [Nezara viridula]|uniref:Uncharacterized protein n=1 Tax=Nezara viridula TaxID=85310 RepID=A0A9P0E267_NEZVI|nr:unnamed protein product [Nezara viridula]